MYFIFHFTEILKDGAIDATASMWMLLPPRRPAVTLTFDLQNRIRSSVRATEYCMQISPRLL